MIRRSDRLFGLGMFVRMLDAQALCPWAPYWTLVPTDKDGAALSLADRVVVALRPWAEGPGGHDQDRTRVRYSAKGPGVAATGESPSLSSAREAARAAFEARAADLEAELDYTVIPIQKLVRVQFGSALLAADYAAERQAPG